ncbi:AMP-binding protein [Marinobacterium lutimaris]|uniref:Long-chain acyl-CoA synthetase (AMP-forming) n=1 Tax=Marinobacterium lutimaris TaxID=568106 RepID=A0A1H6AGP2_9GAMM|nr:AMP-binding protein [Marinobacterium lutimaris]SEG47933.1 Long-chain acyl-CoA synthetase (AMP-forming) [Marinobacterium lutimaris]
MKHHFFTELARYAAIQPNQAALEDEATTLTWRDLPDAINQLASRLEAEAGKRIALLADNSRHWVLTDLAALKLGRVLVPVPLFFSEQQRQHLLAASGIDTLITVTDDQLTITRLPSGYPALHAGTEKITFTSGTTGTPKGVCLSSNNQLRVAQSLVDRLAGLGLSRHLCLLPLATLLENIAGVYCALLLGGTLLTPSLKTLGLKGSSELDLRALAHSLQGYRPDSLIGLPQILAALTGAVEAGVELPVLKFIAVGGARVGVDLIERARRCGLPAYEGYGLSECASVVSLNTPGMDQPGTAGALLPHNRVRLSADNELLIEGNLMLGYLGEAPQGDHFATGDLAQIDDAGFLSIRGRQRNVLISSFGRNLSPEWVESEWLAQPGVQQAVLFGEARPFNVLLVHAPSLSDSTLEATRQRLNTQLPDYARVAGWCRIDTAMTAENGLYTANGRPRRDAIASRYADRIEALYQPAPLAWS